MQATCAHTEVRPALFAYYVHRVTLLCNRASAWITSKCHSFLFLPLLPIYILLLHCTSLTPQRATPEGKSDLLLTQLTGDEITLDMLTFVRVGHYHSPLLMPLFSPQGSLDNISIILLCFPGAPQLSAEALHQEAELEDLLESKVAGGWAQTIRHCRPFKIIQH